MVLSHASPQISKRKLLSFNSLSVVLILLTSTLYHVDILLLKPLVGSRETGYYRAALTIAEFVWFIPSALQMILLHSTSELWANDQEDRITMLISRITRYNLSIVILIAIGLAALSNDFVPLYFGSEFEAAVLPLLLLLPGVLGFALARPIFAAGQGKGKLRILIGATGISAFLNICLNLLLIPRYGISGAAIATSIGYGSMAGLHILAARRIGFNPTVDLRLRKITIVAVITSTVIFGISSVVDSSFLSLIIIPPVGLVVYTHLSVKLGVVSKHEIESLTKRLPDPLGHYI